MSEADEKGLSAEDYHADRIGDRPSLSCSIIKILCTASPKHAWFAHPRLNPEWKPTYRADFDLGSAVHDYFLEGGKRIHVIQSTRKEGTGKNRVDTGEPVTDFRGSEAQEERDAARERGETPLLKKDFERVQVMSAEIRSQLDAHKDASDMFTEGMPEKTVTFEEDGILFRCRLDYLHNDFRHIDDLKTSGISANPEIFQRQMFANGLDIQAALYRKAVKAKYGVEAKFRFAVIEVEAPHALSVIRCADEVIALGEKKIQFAKEIWQKCLLSDDWPGYEPKTAIMNLPAWEDKRWSDKEMLSLGITL